MEVAVWKETMKLMDGLISLMNEKLRSILASNLSVCAPDKTLNLSLACIATKNSIRI
jgi:hypothetical protein